LFLFSVSVAPLLLAGGLLLARNHTRISHLQKTTKNEQPKPKTTSTVPSDRFQGQYAAAKMTELGLKRVVVVYGDSSYGQSLGFAFVAAFTRDGGRAFPLAVPRADNGAAGINASAVVAEVRRSGADGVFLATNMVQFMGGESGGCVMGTGGGCPVDLCVRPAPACIDTKDGGGSRRAAPYCFAFRKTPLTPPLHYNHSLQQQTPSRRCAPRACR
jgi:hypothetical protein